MGVPSSLRLCDNIPTTLCSNTPKSTQRNDIRSMHRNERPEGYAYVVMMSASGKVPHAEKHVQTGSCFCCDRDPPCNAAGAYRKPTYIRCCGQIPCRHQ